MKTTHLTPTVCLGIAALTASVWAQDAVPPAATPPAPEAAAARGGRGGRGSDSITFNFRGASLETVLNYMSEAAGFIIVLETPVRGTVDMFSAQPVTREEAVQLLNFALNRAGYTSLVQGRTIVISSKEDAKKKNLPVRTSNDPDEIPNTAEMFIQIIPLRQLDATNAARNLGTLLPGSSAITADTDSNSLIVTDTNINLKQVVTLVNALDTSSDSISTLKVFKLQNADPYEMAQLLTNLYAAPILGANARGGPNALAQAGRGGAGGGGRGGAAAFGGGGGGRGGVGGAGGRGGRGGGATNRFIPVVAVADPRTYSVIVTASKDAMPDIEAMVAQLDSSSARKQKVFVYTMENANVKQVETTLRNLFPSSNTRAAVNTPVDALTQRANANAQNTATTTIQLGNTGGGAGGRGN